jgi:DNA-binding MarR family transcriptional regulator
MVDVINKRVYTRIMDVRCYCSLLRAATRRLGATYDAALAPLGINIAQYALMSLIQQHQPVSLTQLAHLAELDRSTVGRNVRVLERMKLAIPGRGEVDEREAVVSLTKRGRQVLDEAEPIWESCQSDLADRLGSAGIDALHEVVRIV